MESGTVIYFKRGQPNDDLNKAWCNLVQREDLIVIYVIKICLICIIGLNRQKEKNQRKKPGMEYTLSYSWPCSSSSILSSF